MDRREGSKTGSRVPINREGRKVRKVGQTRGGRKWVNREAADKGLRTVGGRMIGRATGHAMVNLLGNHGEHLSRLAVR